MWKEKAIDYRRFRLDRLNTPEFKHLKYLLFWPVYGFFFLLVERLWIRESYTPIHCPLDDQIPFCEYFLIPYLLWFVFLIGIQIYTLLYDTEAFIKFMKFIMVSYSLAIIIYMLFPNCQELRPMVFERDNLFTKFLEGFYQFDTNTNVCPSIHVIGSVAVMICGWNCKSLNTPGWRIFLGISAFLISISTVFLKQHSVLDILAAIPVCIAAYLAAYWRDRKKKGNITNETENRNTQPEKNG